MAQEQSSSNGGKLLTSAASILGAKKMFFIFLVVFVIFLLPMCGNMSDTTQPPYSNAQIEIFEKIGSEKEVPFVDMMVYHFMVLQDDVTEGTVRKIANSFQYETYSYEEYEDCKKNPITKKEKCVTKERKITEVHNYSLQQMLEGQKINAKDIEAALQLQQVWLLRLTSIPMEELPEDFVIPDSEFMWPTPTLTTITSNYGPRWGRMHYGTDISGSNAIGQPILAIADGRVIQVTTSTNNGCGMNLRIKHSNGFQSRYCHASAILVMNGKEVKKGEVIGVVGNTGTSTTGAHLHIEMKDTNGKNVNPLPYIIGSRP